MKIRTDFVTNSSSSSYCVSLGVDSVGKRKSISLDLWPDEEDDSSSVWVGMRTDLDEFIDQVKDCSTVDELKSLLVNLLDFSGSLSDVDINAADPNEVILQALSEYCEDIDVDDYGYRYVYAFQVSKSFGKFQKELDKIKSLSDIKSVTVREYFSGWGEFAPEGVRDFLQKVLPDDFACANLHNLKELLQGKLTDEEIESIIVGIEEGSICDFMANIVTIINMTDGSVTKEYDFDSPLGIHITKLNEIAGYEFLDTLDEIEDGMPEKMEQLIVPKGVEIIEDSKYYEREDLKEVIIPDSVKSIGEEAFYGCKNLIEITIPDSVTEIGCGAFSECESLAKIAIPEGLTILEDLLFNNCECLTDITIPNGVEIIGERAFHGCSSLTSIAIPDSVTCIRESAFRWCTSLVTIIIPDSVESIGKFVFNDCPNLKEVHIPSGSYAEKFMKKYYSDITIIND